MGSAAISLICVKNSVDKGSPLRMGMLTKLMKGLGKEEVDLEPVKLSVILDLTDFSFVAFVMCSNMGFWNKGLCGFSIDIAERMKEVCNDIGVAKAIEATRKYGSGVFNERQTLVALRSIFPYCDGPDKRTAELPAVEHAVWVARDALFRDFKTTPFELERVLCSLENGRINSRGVRDVVNQFLKSLVVKHFG